MEIDPLKLLFLNIKGKAKQIVYVKDEQKDSIKLELSLGAVYAKLYKSQFLNLLPIVKKRIRNKFKLFQVRWTGRYAFLPQKRNYLSSQRTQLSWKLPGENLKII